eukprot:208079-Hanusia_phi.AAC.1
MSPGGTAVTADRTETSGPATQAAAAPRAEPPSRGLWARSDRPELTPARAAVTQTQSSRYIPLHRVTSKGRRARGEPAKGQKESEGSGRGGGGGEACLLPDA